MDILARVGFSGISGGGMEWFDLILLLIALAVVYADKVYLRWKQYTCVDDALPQILSFAAVLLIAYTGVFGLLSLITNVNAINYFAPLCSMGVVRLLIWLWKPVFTF